MSLACTAKIGGPEVHSYDPWSVLQNESKLKRDSLKKGSGLLLSYTPDFLEGTPAILGHKDEAWLAFCA